jgi:hypothetical protein
VAAVAVTRAIRVIRVVRIRVSSGVFLLDCNASARQVTETTTECQPVAPFGIVPTR